MLSEVCHLCVRLHTYVCVHVCIQVAFMFVPHYSISLPPTNLHSPVGDEHKGNRLHLTSCSFIYIDTAFPQLPLHNIAYGDLEQYSIFTFLRLLK